MSKSDEIKKGSKVKLSENAVIFDTRINFQKWVYNEKLIVKELDGERAVVSLQNGATVGAVHVKNLVRM